MQVIKRVLFGIWSLLFVIEGRAQGDEQQPLKIAVFAPVYLDSAFSGSSYKLGNNNNLPHNILPGLDFYNGVMLAIDSLNTENVQATVLFYDTKSVAEPMELILQKPELAGTSLIIASFNNRSEMKPLADFALANNIPLISATYPNNGGLTANPFFVLLNPTLRTHCEGLYKYLQHIYPTGNMTMFRRKGASEDLIQSIFSEMSRNTPALPLRIKTVELPDNFNTSQVTGYLDSTRQNIVMCGTLNEAFGANLLKALSDNKNFRCVAIGMPTWDGLKETGKDIEVIYSTPYNFQRKDKTGALLTSHYRSKLIGRPSDMVFKGFETMYHFTKLLEKYHNTLINNLSSKDFKLFNEFDIQPVRAGKETLLPDYLENKKLYFIHKSDGQIKSVN
ncbi:MAG: hypothetical protein NVSMB63_12500 [Sediminibacterium sp.]